MKKEAGEVHAHVPRPSPSGLGWAAVVIALAAFAVAVSSAATGRSGKTNTPRAYALVTGPGHVVKRFSHRISNQDVTVNNGAFCIRGVGFKPTHVQVTARSAPTFPEATLDEQAACNGGTAVTFNGDLTYVEDFFIALWG
jgi:hypothetical protein